MANQLAMWARGGQKVGVLGALISAMGCGMCFPALATLGSAIGLGFLSRWEGLFINTLLPIFAIAVLILNGVGVLGHRRWMRAVMGLVGPTLLLLSLYPWFRYGWSSQVTYAALAWMAAMSIWDLRNPPVRRCALAPGATP